VSEHTPTGFPKGLMNHAKFAIGQLVHHSRFDYRGVIVDVDPVFQLSEEWYDAVAKSRPPKDRPWYHVLVHGTHDTTYVAERHLAPTADPTPIEHPQLGEYFEDFRSGVYVSSRTVS